MAKSVEMICLVAAVLFSGCCSAQTIVGPDGKPLQGAHGVVKCSQSPIGCYTQAVRVCGGSYQILDSESHAGGVTTDDLPGPVTWYAMSYMCGSSDGRGADFPFRGPHYKPPGSQTCLQFDSPVSCGEN